MQVKNVWYEQKLAAVVETGESNIVDELRTRNQTLEEQQFKMAEEHRTALINASQRINEQGWKIDEQKGKIDEQQCVIDEQRSKVDELMHRLTDASTDVSQSLIVVKRPLETSELLNGAKQARKRRTRKPHE